MGTPFKSNLTIYEKKITHLSVHEFRCNHTHVSVGENGHQRSLEFPVRRHALFLRQRHAQHQGRQLSCASTKAAGRSSFPYLVCVVWVPCAVILGYLVEIDDRRICRSK